MLWKKHLPPLLIEEVEKGKAAIVGGAIRSEFDKTESSDIDVFVFSLERYENIISKLTIKKENDWLHTLISSQGKEVEIAYEPSCSSAEQCVEYADFDIASGVYSSGKLFYSETFLRATQEKVMSFLGTKAPDLSYGRYLKYNKKYGYTIDDSIYELLKVWQKFSL